MIFGGPGSTGDSLIVLASPVVLPAEEYIIHGTLGGGCHTQGSQENVDDPLRGFHIATHHGRLRGGIQ